MQTLSDIIDNIIAKTKQYEPSFEGWGLAYLDASNRIVIGEGAQKTYAGFFEREKYFYVRQLEKDVANNIDISFECVGGNIMVSVPCRMVVVVNDRCLQKADSEHWKYCFISILLAVGINVNGFNLNTEDAFIKEWTEDFAMNNLSKIGNYRALSIDFNVCLNINKAQSLECYKSCVCN